MFQEKKIRNGLGTGYPKKVKIDCTQSNSYKYYRKNTPKQLLVTDKTEYLKIINLFLKKFMSKIVYQSDELKLPLSLGKLAVKKILFNPETELKRLENINYQTNALLTDWKMSKLYGKRIPYTNEHSNYNRFKFYWDKKTIRTENNGVYNFKPTRFWKRELSKEIITNKRDYFTL